MYAKALALALSLLAAAPAFAAAKADKAAAPDNAGPIPYSELAAADAKLNGPATPVHKAKRVKMAAAKTTTAPAPAAAPAAK